LAFPASSLTVGPWWMAAVGLRRRRAPPGSGSSRSSHRPTRDRSPDRPRPRGLRLLFEASPLPWLARPDLAIRRCWPPLLGFVGTSPPSTHFRDRATPVFPPTRSRIARSGTGAVHVVLHHLDGLPSPEVAGLLHPAADPGVRRVSCAAVLPDEPGIGRCAVPATRFVPLEESPRRQPHHVTVAVASPAVHRPPAVPPCSRSWIVPKAPADRWALARRSLDGPPHTSGGRPAAVLPDADVPPVVGRAPDRRRPPLPDAAPIG
jgi:hypothetical protein